MIEELQYFHLRNSDEKPNRHITNQECLFVGRSKVSVDWNIVPVGLGVVVGWSKGRFV